MRIYKKSRNPYLNLIKSISKIYKDNELEIDEKLSEYNFIFNTFKDDLNKYKFYTHPSFNNKWYKYNDKHVSAINEENVLEYSPYLFIYKRI